MKQIIVSIINAEKHDSIIDNALSIWGYHNMYDILPLLQLLNLPLIFHYRFNTFDLKINSKFFIMNIPK